MATFSKPATVQKLLDPANARLDGQERVNAEIFKAVEILGRKLERTEAERDRLARRLALIETSATLDKKTGKLYLPMVVDNAQGPNGLVFASPKWVATASALSASIAVLALGFVLIHEPPPALTREQVAILSTLATSQSSLPQMADASATPAPENKDLQKAEPEVAATTASVAPPVQAPVQPQPTAAAPVAEPETSLTKQEETLDIPPPPAVDIAAIRAVPPAAPKAAEAPKPVEIISKKEDPKTLAEEVLRDIQPIPLTKAETSFVPDKGAAAEKIALADDSEPSEPETDMLPDTSLPAKLSELEKRAYQGIPEAQHDLATIYASGKVVAQNYKRAIYWFGKAAGGDVANAHYNLGVIYQQGLGVKKDMARAISWYEKAAELGHPEAMYNLGIAYIEGVGTKTSVEKGISYFKRAANAGVAQAAYNLGVLYESNFVGTIDTKQALQWYQMAANEGHSEARIAVGRLQSSNDRALQLADVVEPASGEEYGEGDASPAEEKRVAYPKSRNDLVAKVQQELNNLGLLSDKSDGVMTPQTEDAIRAYQHRIGMTEDGLPSQALLDKMRGKQ